jgi:hypothetical protein
MQRAASPMPPQESMSLTDARLSRAGGHTQLGEKIKPYVDERGIVADGQTEYDKLSGISGTGSMRNRRNCSCTDESLQIAKPRDHHREAFS